MHRMKGRGRAALAGFGLAGALALLPAGVASAADFPNACKNSVSANNSQIEVTMTADAPSAVAPGGSVALTNIQQTLSVPSTIFLAGYNLGVLPEGPNTIPASVVTTIAAANTVQGTQDTNSADGSISTTIDDPDNNPGTGDETATPGSLPVTYGDQTWTAASSGPIEFREATVDPIGAGAGPAHTGGIRISATITSGMFTIPVRFGCSPGTVTGPDPGTVAFDDPAAAFAQTAVGEPSFGKVKLDKKKGTATLPVEVPGAGKVALKQTSTVKGATKTANAASTVKLKVQAKGKAKKALKKKGKAKVKASVTFTPTGGQAITETKKLKLVKK